MFPLLLCAALAILRQPLPAQTGFTEIYAFGAAPDAQAPGGLVRGPDGALYGLSTAGGANDYGAVFRLQPPASPAAPWTESVLYSFATLSEGPAGNFQAPIFGPNGALYGVTAGTVFQLRPPNSPGGPWTETTLYTFQPPPVWAFPLFIAADGILYGTAYGGGYGQGMVFALSPPQSPGLAWTQHTIYSFTGTVDGSVPLSLIAGPNGVLYGTTALGGTYNNGVLFQLTPSGDPRGAWRQTVLFNFNLSTGAPGYSPRASISLYNDGAIYGTAYLSTGYLMQWQPGAGGAWTQTVLYTFSPNGTILSSPLILHNGNLFGTTATINTWGDQYFGGDVFELQKPAAPGGPWTEVILHHFQKLDSPHGNIVFDNGGVIYGATDLSNAAPHQGYAYQLILPTAN